MGVPIAVSPAAGFKWVILWERHTHSNRERHHASPGQDSECYVIAHGIDLSSAEVAHFCRKWQVRELAAFGSVLRSDFRAESDIDFLFTLQEGVRLTLKSWMDMEDELSAILKRKVDLVPRRSVEQSRNPLRRREILESAETVYAVG